MAKVAPVNKGGLYTRVLKKMKVAMEAKPELLKQDLQDKTLINSMISEMEFAIQ